ncbi:MAG: hypothetical protein AAFS10_05810 [Myxococcota bacterium]
MSGETMTHRSYLYDALSLMLVLGSMFFFYQSTQFLVGKDYVAAGLTTLIGVLVIKIGVELGKLALLTRRHERDNEQKR